MRANKTTAAKPISEAKEKSIISRLTFVGVFGNVALCAFKLFAGVVGHSIAMISDGIHSLSDVFATLIAYLGVRLSRRKADAMHPYGHERLECVASLALGLILLATGLGIGKVGLDRIIAGDYEALAVPGTIALVAAIVSIVAKEAMFWYVRHYARVLDSSAFMADAWHHRSDAFSSIGALIGIAGAQLGYPVLDAVASVVICVFILKVAFDIIKDAISKMLDTSGGAALERELAEYIASQPQVERIDLLHSRMFGNRVYVDLEIQVDGDQTLREAHEVAEHVHTAVESEFPQVKHIMIHLNPAEGDGRDEEVAHEK